jgi:hypothetical protein
VDCLSEKVWLGLLVDFILSFRHERRFKGRSEERSIFTCVRYGVMEFSTCVRYGAVE